MGPISRRYAYGDHFNRPRPGLLGEFDSDKSPFGGDAPGVEIDVGVVIGVDAGVSVNRHELAGAARPHQVLLQRETALEDQAGVLRIGRWGVAPGAGREAVGR